MQQVQIGKTLTQRMHNIMEEVKRIKKDAKNTHQNYEYASEKAIKEELHKALVKYGVLFTLNSENPRIEGSVLFIDCKYNFTNKDNKDEVISGTFLGAGNTRDDKGYYAAITGAIKYILTSTFLIPTGDDPELDKNEDENPHKSLENVSPPSTTTVNKPNINNSTGSTGLASSKQKILIEELMKKKMDNKMDKQGEFALELEMEENNIRFNVLTSSGASKIIEFLMAKKV